VYARHGRELMGLKSPVCKLSYENNSNTRERQLWKRPRTRRRHLLALGIPKDDVRMATRSRKGYWRMAGNSIVQQALTKQWLWDQGVPNMRQHPPSPEAMAGHSGLNFTTPDKPDRGDCRHVRRSAPREGGNRPVRTRMPGGVGAGTGLLGQSPATRLDVFCSFSV